MTRKNRYVLIVIGFVFFLLASPALILYVKGISYDFTTRQFVKTGILSLNADPGSAKVFLNGKLARTGNGDIKFLSPGSYAINLQKDGYQEWSKRLFINAGDVTWANPTNNKIYLFLNSPKALTMATGIDDFYVAPAGVVYLSHGNISLLNNNSPAQTENYPTPLGLDALSPSPDGKLFALGQKTPAEATTTVIAAIFNTENHSVVNIGGLFSSPPKFAFAPNNDLYALENNNLYLVNAATSAKTLVLNNIQAFALQKNNIYYIQKSQNGLQLLYASLPNGTPQVLLSNIPSFQNGQIIVTYEKQIFLLLDQTLYQVSGNLNQVADNVSDFYFNPDDSTLSFVHGGELDYYTNALNFISRSSGFTTNLVTNLKINSAFYINNNQVMAIELDTRDRQNQYVLYSGTNLKKLVINKNANQIYILDGNELKRIQIR